MVYTRTSSPMAKKRKAANSTTSSRVISKISNNSTPDGNQTSIKVIVRVRPPNQRENQDNYRTVVKVCDSHMLVFDPKEEEDPFYYRGVVQKGRNILKKQNKNLEFMFNRVFDDTSTNSDVFEGSTRDMIANLLDGYNCSVFAYGATGAGKTHTMLGKSNDPGITFRTVEELFNQIDQNREQRDFNLGVTYLEIYNENVQDLLEKRGPLFLREDAQRGVVVSGLNIITITSADELLGLLTKGNKNRTQYPTDANGESSRSHAVFQVYINMRNKLDGQKKCVKLSMIDLAGSERASVTGCKGERFKEGANINKSLLALGNCINNLADGVKHIPYRDSKLTRLLKDSLGGNCHTVMIANVSPSSFSYEDTYNTLKYANRAKKIKTSLKKNIVACTLSASDYAMMLEAMKKENALMKRENALLKSKLQAYESGNAPKVTAVVSAPVEKESIVKKQNYELIKQQFLDKFQNLWNRKKALNEKILSLESKDKILCCRMKSKISAQERLNHLTAVADLQEDHNVSGKKRVNKSFVYFERQRERIRPELESAWSELRTVEQELRALETKVSEKNVGDVLAKDKALLRSELSKVLAQQEREHAKKICSLLQCEYSSIDNVMTTICQVTQRYYNLQDNNGTMTEEMRQEFQKLVKKLEGVRGIKWSDDSLERNEKDFYEMIVLDIERLDSPLTQSASMYDFKYDKNDEGDSTEVTEMQEASNSLNDTFSIDTSSRTVKKRALVERNSIEKDASPAKQAKKIITAKKHTLPDKENHKNMMKPISAKNLEILNRLKTSGAQAIKLGQDKTSVKSSISNQKTSKALPSTRKPW